MKYFARVEPEVRDPAAISAACRRLKLPEPTAGTFHLLHSLATGLAVRLAAWRYPLVCDVQSGSLAYDNHGGMWGDERALDAFLQAYAIEKTRLEARRRGDAVTEQPLPGGAVKLILHAGEAS